jgi:IS30 family transposase
MDRRSSHEGRSNFSVEEICSAMGAGVAVVFCDAYCPWQRGSNENTNGLLRQYFPKKTDLSLHTPEHVQKIVAEINSRPREVLEWQTPFEVLEAAAIAMTA